MTLEDNVKEFDVTYLGLDDKRQGIVLHISLARSRASPSPAPQSSVETVIRRRMVRLEL